MLKIFGMGKHAETTTSSQKTLTVCTQNSTGKNTPTQAKAFSTDFIKACTANMLPYSSSNPGCCSISYSEGVNLRQQLLSRHARML